jgi:hypothetical protein
MSLAALSLLMSGGSDSPISVLLASEFLVAKWSVAWALMLAALFVGNLI